jgi:hypothetical protein
MFLKNTSQQQATDIANQAVQQFIGVKDNNPQLIDFGANAVFQLDDFFIKVDLQSRNRDSILKQISFTDFLNRKGCLTEEHLIKDPLEIDQHLVMITKAIPASNIQLDPYKWGETVKKFHHLAKSYPGNLNKWSKLDNCYLYLQRLKKTNTDICELDVWQKEFNRINELLPSLLQSVDLYPTHGDINQGNLIIDHSDNYHLIDFDQATFAPQEVDLAKRLAAAKVSKIGQQQLNDFFSGYHLFTVDNYLIGLLSDLQLLEDCLFIASMKKTGDINQEKQRRLAYYLNNRLIEDQWWQSVW